MYELSGWVIIVRCRNVMRTIMHKNVYCWSYVFILAKTTLP